MVTTEAIVLSGETSKLHQWEVSAWLLCRCVENLATSTSTLRSLAQLLEEIGNIVINDEIGKEVCICRAMKHEKWFISTFESVIVVLFCCIFSECEASDLKLLNLQHYHYLLACLVSDQEADLQPHIKIQTQV